MLKQDFESTKNSNPKIGVFVDNANLFYAQKQSGWKIDIQKLKDIFNSLNLQFIRYYLALPAEDDSVFNKTKKYINKISSFVDIRTKPLKYISIGNKIIKKGDVDVDIAVDVIESIDEYDIAVIVSGDSDYIALRDFLLRRDKKITPEFDLGRILLPLLYSIENKSQVK